MSAKARGGKACSMTGNAAGMAGWDVILEDQVKEFRLDLVCEGSCRKFFCRGGGTVL